MGDIIKIIPLTLLELGRMDYMNLLILVIAIAVWRLPEIIHALRGKVENEDDKEGK